MVTGRTEDRLQRERAQHNDQLFVSDPNGANRRKITHACDECSVYADAPSWQPLR